MDFYDPLTHLANRRLLMDQLNAEISLARRNQLLGAVIFLDLDRLKLLNDSLGHHLGDQLLILVSERIKSAIREEDLAARLGADEFVVLIKAQQVGLDQLSDLTWVVADKIRTVLEQPYEIDHYTHHSTCSVGITFFPDKEQQNSVDILQQADAARYETKELGRNTVSFYSSLRQQANKTYVIENEMRIALKKGEYLIYLGLLSTTG